MTSSIDAPARAATPTRALEAAAYRWWSALGAAFISFSLYLYTRWIVAGNATPNSRGSSAAPGWMHVAVGVHVVLGAVAFAGCIWWYLVRPWLRQRGITTDGLLMVACMTSFWGDLSMNYFRYNVLYTSLWPNLGAWYNFIPGWQPPNGQLLAEATPFILPMYAVVMFGWTRVACNAMGRAQRRNPEIRKVRLFLLAWLLVAVIDLVFEVVWLRLGLIVFPSTIPSLTLFHGHYYQFPVYEAVLWGFALASFSAVRYFRNDLGETIAERGISRFRGSPRQRVVVRFLALAAVANVTMVGFNLSHALVSRHGSDWPEDITNRPYFVQGLCGPDTSYACPNGVAPTSTEP